MLCLLWQTLLSRGAKGLMVVLVPSTLSASKRRSRSTLAITKPPQTMTTVFSRTRAGLCPSCSQWTHPMIFHLCFGLLSSDPKHLFNLTFHFACCSPFLQADIKVRAICAFCHVRWCSSLSHIAIHNDDTFTAPQVFLQSNSFAKFTPRAVARIMHGISSPGFPSATWSKNHFWSVYSLPCLCHLFYLPTNYSRAEVSLAGGAMWRLISQWSWKLPKLNSSNSSGKESSSRQHGNQN
jgi:hypothetical protein